MTEITITTPAATLVLRSREAGVDLCVFDAFHDTASIDACDALVVINLTAEHCREVAGILTDTAGAA